MSAHIPKLNPSLDLPDPLLVRLYQEGLLAAVAAVHIEPTTRDVLIRFKDDSTLLFLFLEDVGWVPEHGS